MDISIELQDELFRARRAFDEAVSNSTPDVAARGTEYLGLLNQEQHEIGKHLGSIPAANIPGPSSHGGAVVDLHDEAKRLADINRAEQTRVRATLNET
jgi:hypothetical protein